MSKINATYSSGYYLAPDADYRKVEDEREAQRRKRRRDEKKANKVTGKDNNEQNNQEMSTLAQYSDDKDVKRQTFAIPFDLICLHCDKRIARGTHVYTNRRFSGDKYLNAIKIWSLEIRCKYCHEPFILRTDPETAKQTGGYVCASHCRRIAGDFSTLNKFNEEVKNASTAEQEEAELNPLEALERENETARLLAERNRAIAEDVAAHAIEASHLGNDGNLNSDSEMTLLASLRLRHRNNNIKNNSNNKNNTNDDDDNEGSKNAKCDRQETSTFTITPRSTNLINLNSGNNVNEDDSALLSRWQQICTHRPHTVSQNTTIGSISTLQRHARQPVHKNKFMVDDEDDDDDDDEYK